MKRWFLCFLLLLMCGCSTFQREAVYLEVTPSQVLDLIENENTNTFLFYVVSDYCYSCDEFDKVIAELKEQYSFKVYRMKVDLEEEDETIIQDLKALQVTTGHLTQLPMIYYVHKGELPKMNIKAGYIEKKEMELWLKEINMIQ